MASIIELIKNIRNARLGKDVRESIASAIEKTYEDASKDGNANMEVSEARGTFDTLNQRLNNSDNVKADKIEVQKQINSLASGSPLVASSVSEMTDTSRVYVNTTDGYWYYYNGTAWVDGGVYQASEFANNSIDSNTIKKLDFQKVKFSNIIDDMSNALAWHNVIINYKYGNKIQFDTSNYSGDAGIFLPPFTKIDKTRDLYCFMTINSQIIFNVFLFNGSTYVKRICGYNPLNKMPSMYFRIASDDLNIDDPKIVIASAENGIITLDNIYAGNYDIYDYIYNNLINKLNNINYYDEIKDDVIKTDITKWIPNYFGNNVVLYPSYKRRFAIENTSTAGRSRGLESPLYNDTSKKLIIECDPTNISQTDYKFSFCIYYNDTYENIGNQTQVDNNGHLKIILDLPYFAVYKNLTNYKIWLMIEEPGIVKFDNFKFYWSDIAESSIYDENFIQMIKKIESNINNSTKAKNELQYLQAPNNKYFIQANDNGILQLIDVIPNKALFIGNSLLLGNHHENFAFGMCASDINNDYYYHITQFILNKKTNATFEKLSGVDFENATTQEMVDNFLNDTLLPKLNNDLQLVIVQLGDNVNTSNKVNIFKSSCLELLKFIRINSPNARVVFVGEWYSSSEKQTIIANACKNSGTQFVDISPLNIEENQASVGTIITFPDGYTNTVSSSGVASHPSNIGFEKIANKIIENIF